MLRCRPYITGCAGRSKAAAKGNDRWANTTTRVWIDLSAHVRRWVAQTKRALQVQWRWQSWIPHRSSISILPPAPNTHSSLYLCEHLHWPAFISSSFVHSENNIAKDWPQADLRSPQIFNMDVAAKSEEQPKNILAPGRKIGSWLVRRTLLAAPRSTDTNTVARSDQRPQRGNEGTLRVLPDQTCGSVTSRTARLSRDLSPETFRFTP